jgi:protein CWC15
MRYRDLAGELDRREQEFAAEKNSHVLQIQAEESAVDTQRLLLTAAEGLGSASNKAPAAYDDADAEGSDDDFESSSDEDDDEDDELELQRELEQIKRDREAAAARKAEEQNAESERVAMDAAVKGNPLLHTEETTARVKRQWNDDVVFKNQTRGEPELKKRFVNDTIRSDFHRSFLKKYVR